MTMIKVLLLGLSFTTLVCRVSVSAQCSLTCGSGVRRRNITCSRNTGIDCDPQKKPPAVSACSIQECPQEADNFGRDWSGSGWPSNDLLNEINSIPAMKPALRYSTGRAQPTPGADFHYHNNIEDIQRSPEGSVQVDDFYYDYNFINFHEDLSDGFDSNGNGAEGVFGAPQDVEPSQTAPKVTMETLEMEEMAHTKLEPTEDTGNAAAENSEGLEDLLSEDYLLPVSTTRSPPVRHSQTQKERNDRLGVPARDVNTPEAENGFHFTADSLPDNGDMSATHPGYQTTISVLPSKPTSTPAGHDGVYGDSYDKERTLIPEHQGSVQLVERASEIAQTPSQSFVFPSGFRLEDLAPDHSDFRTYATGRYSKDTDFNPTSASEDSTPTSLPFLQTSGNQQASVSSTSSGIGTEPPPDLEGATQPSPADLLPAARKYDPTEPPFSEEGLSPQAPWLDVAAPDETVTSITVRSGGSEPPPGTTAAPEKITTEMPHRDPPTSPHSAVLWPPLLPTSVQTTASAQVTFPGYWISGNWSTVSLSLTINYRFRILLSSDK